MSDKKCILSLTQKLVYHVLTKHLFYLYNTFGFYQKLQIERSSGGQKKKLLTLF